LSSADIPGFTEAAFFPGAIFLLSLFYTKKQMALRTAILYSGSQVGNAFGGLFALAILELDGAHGIKGWRWLFIVEGIMSKYEALKTVGGKSEADFGSCRPWDNFCLHHPQSSHQHSMAYWSRT
jgi:MFS family permease